MKLQGVPVIASRHKAKFARFNGLPVLLFTGEFNK